MRGEFYISARRFRAFMTALVTAGVMAVPVAAQAIDWYGGLSVGQAGHETTGGDLAGQGFLGSVDGNDSGWKVLLGMVFGINMSALSLVMLIWARPARRVRYRAQLSPPKLTQQRIPRLSWGSFPSATNWVLP